MSDTTLRLTGRPVIERDPSGLRKITRQYIVQGSSVTEGKVEAEVFLPFGTPDLEYDETITQDLTNGGLTNSEVTGAYLVEQNLQPGQSINEAMLTRVYQELDASSEPVLIGKPEVVRGENNRLTLQKTFIVKNPYIDHYKPDRIGQESITIHGAELLLGSVQSKESQVFTQFTEIYYEEGILSESVEYKFGQYPNHRLEVRTLRSIDIPQTPPTTEGPGNGPWFRVSEKEGPGNRDFGQIGKTIKTIVFAKGEGLISEQSQVKGKPPNTVEVITIKYITGDNGTVPPANIPAFTRRTQDSTEEKDGYELHTISGIVLSTENGVVDVKVQYKHGEKPNHKLEVAQATSYGIPADSQDVLDFVYPGGDTTSLGAYVLIEERENTQGEFDVFTTTFARGLGTVQASSRKVGMTTVSELVSLHPSKPTLSIELQPGELTRRVEFLDGYQKLTIAKTTEDSGIVDQRVQYRNNGALVVKSIMQLGDEWDDDNTPGGDYALIETRNHRYDIYPAITRVYAQGTGVVSESSKKVGFTTVTKTTSMHPADEVLESDIQGNELSRDLRQEEGYQLLTVEETTEDSGIVDEKTDERNNGKLIIKTITQLGSVWNNASTPGGYAEISVRNHRFDIYPAITKVYAKGAGVISTSSKKVGLTTVTETTSLHAALPVLDSDITGNELTKEVRQEEGYQIKKVSETTGQSGVVDRREDERHQGNLKILRITQLGDTWNTTVGNYVQVSERKHTFDIYPAITREYAKGVGEISNSFRKIASALIETVVTLSKGPKPTLPSDALSGAIVAEQGHWKTTIERQSQNKKLVDAKDEKRNFDLLQYASRTILGTSWDDTFTPAGYVQISTRKHSFNNMPAVTNEFMKGDGVISEETKSGNNRYKIVKKTILTPFSSPPDSYIPGNAVEVKKVTKEGHSIIEYEVRTPHTQQPSDSTWSAGLQRITKENLNDPASGFPSDSYTLTSKFTPIDFKNVLHTESVVKPGEFKTIAKNFNKFFLRIATEEYSTSSDIGEYEGSVTQIADGFYKTRKTEYKPASYEFKDIVYSGGLKRITQQGPITSVSGSYGDFDSAEAYMLNEVYGVERTTKSEAATFSRTSFAYSKHREVTSSTTLGDANPPLVPGQTVVLSRSTEQLGEKIFRHELSTADAPKTSGEKKVVPGGGGAYRIETDTTYQKTAPTIGSDEFKSINFIDKVRGYETETVHFKEGTFVDKYSKTTPNYTKTSTTTVSKSSALPDTSIGGAKNLEKEARVVQIAPGIFKTTESETGKSAGSSVLSHQMRIVMGGFVFSATNTIPANGVSGVPALPQGAIPMSATRSIQYINGIETEVINRVWFVPKPNSYYTVEKKAFTFPGVAGISDQGIWHIPSYRNLISVKTNHFINTGGAMNSIGQPYIPPVATLSYRAIPATGAAMTESVVITNCEVDTAGLAGGPQWFKNVWCTDVQFEISGEAVGSNNFRNMDMGSDTEVLSTYGNTAVFHYALHTSL